MPSRPPPRLWIVSPKSAARVARRCAGNDLEWCYLGTDTSQREAAACALSSIRRVTVSDDLTQVAYKVKQPFLDWIAEMGTHQRDPVVWWGSTLASRSPLQTEIFLLVCYVQLVQSWLSQDRITARRIVVVEDPWLALVLRRCCAQDRRVAFAGSPVGRCLFDAAFRLINAPLVFLHTFLWAVNAMLRVRRFFPQPDAAWAGGDQRLILLYSWIEPRCFSTPGKLVDPWTGRLTEILASRGEAVRRLSSLEIPTRLLPTLKGFASRLVVTPRYLYLQDVARALLCWFSIRDLRGLASFHGCNCAPLLYREQLQEWERSNFTRYRLLYFAMRRIAERHGARVKCVIYPFENQPWEKLFCLAWREHAPHVKLIGYQHADVPSLLLPYSLGRREHETIPLPDRIVANSEFNLRRLRDGGYPAERLMIGGALRHEYVHRNFAVQHVSTNQPEPPGTRRQKTVLVTFPLSRPESSCLFADLLEEFREPLRLEQEGGEPVQLIVKCHPRLPVSVFHRGKVTLPPWMRLSQEPLDAVLPGVDLLLYVGPTSSWWDALLSGVPVLKYQPDFLDIDSGHALDGWSAPVCTKDTLRSSIASLLDRSSAAIQPDAGVVERMLGSVNEDVWMTLAAE